MSDVTNRPKAPEKRVSLAEMAAKAASKSLPAKNDTASTGRVSSPHTARRTMSPSLAPPPAPRSPHKEPAGSTAGDGSGLIHLNHLTVPPSFAPAVRHLPPPGAAPASPPTSFAPQLAPATGSSTGSRFRGGFAGVLIALAGLGTAYGLAARQGTDPIHKARGYLAEEGAPATGSLAETAASPGAAATQIAANSAGGETPGTPNVHQVVEPQAVAADPAQADPMSETDKPKSKLHPEAKPVLTRAAASAPAKSVPGVATATATTPAAPSVPAKPAPEPEQGGLAGAMKKAVGPTDAPAAAVVTPAAPQPIRGDIPEVPPQGAIQGALGGQRGAARECVAGQDAPSRANIVFAATGKVQSVTVSGPAAGTPAEACIRAAYTKASVGPFRRPTFSLSTTITPP